MHTEANTQSWHIYFWEDMSETDNAAALGALKAENG